MQKGRRVLGVAAVVLVGAVLGAVLWPKSTLEQPPEPTVPTEAPPVPEPQVEPEPVAGAREAPGDFATEWSEVREAVLAHEPEALERTRALVKRWEGVTPLPEGLLDARSITHLQRVEDAARSLR